MATKKMRESVSRDQQYLKDIGVQFPETDLPRDYKQYGSLEEMHSQFQKDLVKAKAIDDARTSGGMLSYPLPGRTPTMTADGVESRYRRSVIEKFGPSLYTEDGWLDIGVPYAVSVTAKGDIVPDYDLTEGSTTYAVQGSGNPGSYGETAEIGKTQRDLTSGNMLQNVTIPLLGSAFGGPLGGAVAGALVGGDSKGGGLGFSDIVKAGTNLADGRKTPTRKAATPNVGPGLFDDIPRPQRPPAPEREPDIDLQPPRQDYEIPEWDEEYDPYKEYDPNLLPPRVPEQPSHQTGGGGGGGGGASAKTPFEEALERQWAENPELLEEAIRQNPEAFGVTPPEQTPFEKALEEQWKNNPELLEEAIRQNPEAFGLPSTDTSPTTDLLWEYLGEGRFRNVMDGRVAHRDGTENAVVGDRYSLADEDVGSDIVDINTDDTTRDDTSLSTGPWSYAGSGQYINILTGETARGGTDAVYEQVYDSPHAQGDLPSGGSGGSTGSGDYGGGELTLGPGDPRSYRDPGTSGSGSSGTGTGSGGQGTGSGQGVGGGAGGGGFSSGGAGSNYEDFMANMAYRPTPIQQVQVTPTQYLEGLMTRLSR